MPAKTYTPAEIAKFFDVYPSSVNNWIKEGRLKAYTTPGGHNRIPAKDLVSFVHATKLEMPEELRAVKIENHHVLIVDDEPAMVGMLEHALSVHPGLFTFESRLNGMAALLQIGKRKPALVVLDIMMPEMDGWAVIDHLKASPETRDIRFIIVSGQKPVPSTEKLAAHKVDAFFDKPFDTDEFLKKAAQLVGASLPDPKP